MSLNRNTTTQRKIPFQGNNGNRQNEIENTNKKDVQDWFERLKEFITDLPIKETSKTESAKKFSVE